MNTEYSLLITCCCPKANVKEALRDEAGTYYIQGGGTIEFVFNQGKNDNYLYYQNQWREYEDEVTVDLMQNSHTPV